MERTPFYFHPGKKPGSCDFYRNYQCPNYDLCLCEAARKDLYLDCSTCLLKDNVSDRYALRINGWD